MRDWHMLAVGHGTSQDTGARMMQDGGGVAYGLSSRLSSRPGWGPRP